MKKKWIAVLGCLCLLATVCIATVIWECNQGISNLFAPSEERWFEMLFDLNNTVTLRLDMSEEEIAKMQADYTRYQEQGSKSPIYRMGTLHVTVTLPDGREYTEEIPQVGVRMKGNTSRTDFYNSEDGIYNLIHLKINFQATFDDEEVYGEDAIQWSSDERKERKNRTFATLEKLDLRWNRCDDSTYLKEYFAYETYRRYGVPAPHTNLAGFDWAGIHMGVYTINEPVDKIFLEKNFPESALGGDLYKVGWAGNQNGSFLETDSIGVEDEDAGAFFAYDLKTNKKTSTHQALKGFISAMNSGSMTKEGFADLVDTETFLPYAAVSYLLGNPDDMRNNYNNFYVYFRADNGKAVFIPYDYDRCLGITVHWNPTHTGVTDDNPFSLVRQAADRNDPNADSRQNNPVILYSVAEGGYYIREYAELLRTIADGDWFCSETFSDLYHTAEANYAALITPGKPFRNADGLFLSFDLARTSDFSANGNISIQEYLSAKQKTLWSYLADTDTYDTGTPHISHTWYLRADFTDWAMNDAFTLSFDGLWSIRIHLTGSSAMKIYNSQTDGWYGSECVSPDSPVQCNTDGSTNIVLPAGDYRLSIDPATKVILLEQEDA